MLGFAIKTFKDGGWKLRSCFLGVALCVAEMFTFLAINNNLFRQTTNSLLKDAVISDILRFYFTFTAVTVLGIYYSLKSYFGRRLKDYRVLYLLGAKSTSIMGLVVLEYFIGSLIAIAEGLILGNAAFLLARFILKNTSQYNIWNGYYVGNSYQIVLLLSSLTILVVGGFFVLKYSFENAGYQLMRNDGQNYTEGLPAIQGQLVRVIIGFILVIFSVLSYRYLIVNVQYLILPYISISIGLVMVLYPMACWLVRTKLSGKTHLRKKLGLLSMLEKNRTIFNRIVIVAAIDIFAMGYVAVVISDFLPVSSEEFPYDAVIMTNEMNVNECEALVKQFSGKTYNYPMVRMNDWYGYEDIGVSEDVYRELGGKCEKLSKGEVVISHQNQHADEPVSGYDMKSSNGFDQDHYFYRGKYRAEHGWDDLFPDQNFGHLVTENKYLLKEIKFENLIGQCLVDDGNMAESLIVFSNREFDSIREELMTRQDEPTTLILCRFPNSTKKDALRAVEQRLPMLCPEDNTTAGQKNWYTSDNSAEEISRYRMGGLSEMIILLLVMIMSATVQMIVNNVSDQRDMERRLSWLGCLGYPKRTIRKIVATQYRIVPYFALTVSIIGAYLMRTGYVELQFRDNSYYNDDGGKIWIMIISAYIICRMITSELITILQREKIIRNIMIV